MLPRRAYPADELNIIAFNVFDDKDIRLRQEVERKVIHGIAKNALLDQEDVAARLFDLLHHIYNVLPLFSQNPVHRRVVRDSDIVLQHHEQ